MIGIINYDAGNLASVANALDRLNAEYTITADKERLDRTKGIIFPGVGHAEPAMKSLRDNGLDTWLRRTTKPVLGICLGMQLLYETSEEGSTGGLGLIPGTLKKFDPSLGKVPHMGWNTFSNIEKHPLLKGIGPGDYFYFVHSFYAPENEYSIATCRYLHPFAAAVARNHIMGVQFHPEKSGGPGSRLLQNYISIVENR